MTVDTEQGSLGADGYKNAIPWKAFYFTIILTFSLITLLIVTVFYFRSKVTEISTLDFPIFERSAINIRMSQNIQRKLNDLIKNPDREEMSFFLEEQGVLGSNLKEYKKLAKEKKITDQLINNVDPEKVFTFNKKILDLLKENEISKALMLFESEKYLNEVESFRFSIGQIAETLSTKRDQTLLFAQKVVLFISFFSLIALGLIVTMSYKVVHVFLRNIKAQKELAQSLEEERAASIESSRMASLGILAAGVGHEINNPLAIITLSTDLIISKIRSNNWMDSFFEKRLNSIQDSSKRISKIVLGLKTMARADTEEEESLDAHYYIEKIGSMIEEIYHGDGVKISLELKASQHFIRGNGGKIQQIIVNLLSNARDALLEAHVEDPQIQIISENEGMNFIVKVKDNGPGIPPEVQEKVFDTFFTTKEVGKGTGMGLSLCRKIIQDMGGDITLLSEKGQGSCFSLTFPNTSPVRSKKIEEEMTAESVDDLPPIKLIVAEDEPFLREALAETLEDMGVKVVYLAEDGEDAWNKIQTLQEGDLEVLITDLKMPKMNGEQLIETIEKNNKRHFKIVISSGGIETEFDEGHADKIRSMADGIIDKPYRRVQIHELLRTIKV